MLSACLEEGAYDKLFLCWERIDDSKKQMSMESELIRMNVLLTKQNAGNVWAQFSNLKRGGFAAGCVLPVKASYRERLVELVPLDERQRREDLAERFSKKAEFPELIPKKVVSTVAIEGHSEASSVGAGKADESLSLLHVEFRDFKRAMENTVDAIQLSLNDIKADYHKMVEVVNTLVDESDEIEEVNDSFASGSSARKDTVDEPPAWVPKKRSRDESVLDLEAAAEPPQKKKRGAAK